MHWSRNRPPAAAPVRLFLIHPARRPPMTCCTRSNRGPRLGCNSLTRPTSKFLSIGSSFNLSLRTSHANASVTEKSDGPRFIVSGELVLGEALVDLVQRRERVDGVLTQVHWLTIGRYT